MSVRSTANWNTVLADAIGTLVAPGRAEGTIRKWLEPPIKHVEDRCTGRKWRPTEHAVCPGDMLRAKPCAGSCGQ